MILDPQTGEEYCFYCRENGENDRRIAEQVKRAQETKHLRQLLQHYEKHSLMNRDLVAATLENYTPRTGSQEEAKKAAGEYIQTFDGERGLFLIGSYGVGKSHLLAAISKGVIAHHQKSSIFISIPRLLREIKSTFTGGSLHGIISEGEILDALEAVDLLILDDLGAERRDAGDQGKDYANGLINQIADFRVGRATCFSSNYSPEQLMDMYGERDFSRMIQYADIVEVTGPNERIARFT